jgi:hypothetical protein
MVETPTFSASAAARKPPWPSPILFGHSAAIGTSARSARNCSSARTSGLAGKAMGAPSSIDGPESRMHVKKSEYEQRNPKPDRPKGRNGQYLTMEKPSHARNAGALNPGRHRYRHSTCSIMSTKRSATATSITSSAAWEKSLGRLRGMVVVICHTYEGVSRPSGLAVPRGQPPPATHAIFVARIRNDGVMKSYFIHRAAGAGFSGHFGNMRR